MPSNLKCALYGDIHTAAEKTNLGGQQLLPPPAGLTYITNSTGWAANSLAEPAVPSGYEYVFGPVNGANNAPGVSFFRFAFAINKNANFLTNSTWVSPSWTNTTSAHVPRCVTHVVLIPWEALASSSTFGEPS